MSFSLPKFLRQAPAESLQTYFEERKILQAASIQWDASSRRLVDTLRVMIEGLSDRDRERVYDDFERVCQIADDTGQLALRGMVGDAPELLDAISEMDSHEGRGLLVLLRRPDAFDHALSAAYAERLQYGRTWNRFSLRGPLPSDAGAAALNALAEEIRRLFEAFDGSGRRVWIDHFDRPGTGAFVSPSDRLVQYTIYVEKLPESSLEFSEDRPARRTLRAAREAALCLDYGSGILDVLSEGGKEMREKIAHAFARLTLGEEARLEPVDRRDFQLDRLKRPIPFSTDPVDGIKSVTVTKLGLATMYGSYGRVTIEIGRASSESIHSASERWFGAAEPISRLDWRVVHAKLRIIFHPEASGRREKVVVAELRAPNSSNLKNQTRRHQLVSEKYIERWGLAAP
jgi:hypothetical protein